MKKVRELTDKDKKIILEQNKGQEIDICKLDEGIKKTLKESFVKKKRPNKK